MIQSSNTSMQWSNSAFPSDLKDTRRKDDNTGISKGHLHEAKNAINNHISGNARPFSMHSSNLFSSSADDNDNLHHGCKELNVNDKSCLLENECNGNRAEAVSHCYNGDADIESEDHSSIHSMNGHNIDTYDDEDDDQLTVEPMTPERRQRHAEFVRKRRLHYEAMKRDLERAKQNMS